MGLFGMFRKDPEKLDRRDRPNPPWKLLNHWNDEFQCVYGTIYHQDVLEPIRKPTVRVTVARDAGPYGHEVTLRDGTVVGNIPAELVWRVAMDAKRRVDAEVSRPIYRNTEHVELYVPLSDAALAADAEERERRRKNDELTIWVNLDGSKWNGPTFSTGEIEYHGADFSIVERKGAKPLLSVVADGATLMTFNARMKAYKPLMERSERHIRLLIVECRNSEYGTFYKVGFYF